MQIHRRKIGGAQEDQTNDPKTADCNSSQPAGRAKVSAGPSRYHQTYLEEAINCHTWYIGLKDSGCMALFWYFLCSQNSHEIQHARQDDELQRLILSHLLGCP